MTENHVSNTGLQMQNDTFEFMFCDKTGVDERSFFFCFMPRLLRPGESPSP